MTKTVEAIYENGLLELMEPIPLKGRARVRVVVEIPESGPEPSHGGRSAPSPSVPGAESANNATLRRQLSRMSPENRSLFEKVRALRKRIGPVSVDVVETLRELREHD